MTDARLEEIEKRVKPADWMRRAAEEICCQPSCPEGVEADEANFAGIIAKHCRAAQATGGEWQPIETAPKDGTPVIFANFTEMCLLSGAPHTWSGRYAYMGSARELMMLECSHAAMNENGEPTHWVPMPPLSARPTPQAKEGAPTAPGGE